MTQRKTSKAKLPETAENQEQVEDISPELEDIETAQLAPEPEKQSLKFDTHPRPGDYTPLAKEKHLVHIEVEQEAGYDMRTGKKISSPRIIKAEEKELSAYMDVYPKLGYKVRVLYKPKAKS